MVLNFTTNLQKFEHALKELPLAFLPYFKQYKNNGQVAVSIDLLEQTEQNLGQNFVVQINNKTYKSKPVNNSVDSHQTKYHARIALYKALSAYTGVKLAYGASTGIRPLKLVTDLSAKTLQRKYLISKQKSKLLIDVARTQKALGLDKATNFVDIYVHIPFCISKCVYCSFLSADINKHSQKVSPYVNALLADIQNIKQVVRANNLRVQNIYIGGGTPSSLPLEHTEKILQALSCFASALEYTYEAGRPDTITAELLDLLAKYGVTRICINPQTFSENTLKTIGRNHTLADIYSAFALAKKHNFIINTDLIAGLPGETFKDFKNTLTKTLALNPHNITIHSMSVKLGSPLKQNNFSHTKNEKVVAKMLKYAGKLLAKNNYKPYYLYRQKNISANAENVGYFQITNYKLQCTNYNVQITNCGTKNPISNPTLPKQPMPISASLFNINSMHDLYSILAAGAGGISKIVKYKVPTSTEAQPTETQVQPTETQALTIEKIERFCNYKDVDLYTNNFNELLKRRDNFFTEHLH
ncbi:MAG: coproporphyrinogen dehydrogenase HemZ [Firmicutes bacterium]|nr:coproporphyrinogen dehydrogenase HemZ [Bacillota bacterium]